MNTTTAPLALDPSSLAGLGARVYKFLADALAPTTPTAAPVPAKKAAAVAQRPAVAPNQPDLIKLYRMAGASDSVNPAIAAELDRFRAVADATTAQ